MVSTWFWAPRPRVAGDTLDTTGAPATVNAAVLVNVPLSGLVTVRSRAVVAAPAATSTVTVSCVAESRVTPVTVTPVPLNTTSAVVSPASKFVPVTVSAAAVAPCGRELGDTVSTVGRAFTVNPSTSVSAPKSAFVTVTSRAPVAAELVTVTVAVIWVTPVTVGDPTTLTPVPLNDTVAPLAKPVPLTTTDWLVAPWPSWLGFTPLTDGPVATVNAPVLLADTLSVFVTVKSLAPGVTESGTATVAFT